MKNKKILVFNLLLFLMIILSGCSLVNDISINSGLKEKTIYVGDKILLTVNKTTLSTITWESSNESIATVNEEGIVEGISAGVVDIKVSIDSTSTSIKLTVIDLNNTEVIKVSGKQLVLVNETTTFKATSTIENAEIKWSTSDSTIATIDQLGVLKALLPGVVSIRATLASNNSLYDEIIVVVKTGNGIQDVINNYINQNTYISNGDYDLTKLNEKVVNMVKSVEKSVIGVSSYSNPNGTTLAGTGTGGIYKKEQLSDGYKYTVFTNHHVIEDAKAIKVYLGDIDEYVSATLIRSNAKVDIAVITFEHKNNYEVLQFADLDSVNNGDFVVAIGNPGGYTYYGSVTFGMVSANKRVLSDSDVIYVQHDTPINPGNSGGPLFNLDGKVIGINTLKLASSDIEGMGFAISLHSFLELIK